MSDVERLWKAGLALGANLTNTIAIGENKIMNREGLRYPQEFVRHKILDAVGDLRSCRQAAARRLPLGEGRPPPQLAGGAGAARRSRKPGPSLQAPRVREAKPVDIGFRHRRRGIIRPTLYDTECARPSVAALPF